jgi:uncharacterized oxidoreductase
VATRSVSAEELQQLGTRLFDAAGSPHEESTVISEILVRSSLMGHDSHGIVRFVEYINRLKAKELKPGAPFEIVQEAPCLAVVDGHGGWGALTARRAMQLAIEKARQSGVGTVVIRNCAHIGRLGEYSAMAAAAGMMGAVFVNSHGSRDMVAPWGGIEARLSANPLSWAAPTGYDWPFMVDVTTSVLPEGKVRVALHSGKKLPEGCLIDHEGKPSTNPADLYASPPGALLTLGGVVGHKGYGLNLGMELFAGALSGAGCVGQQNLVSGNGVFLQAISISHFIPLDHFTASVQDLIRHVKSARTRPEVAEILVPGEIEYRNQRQRLAEGIPVSDGIWEQLLGAATELGVTL